MSKLNDFLKTFDFKKYSKVDPRLYCHVSCFPDDVDSLSDYVRKYKLYDKLYLGC